MKKVNVKYNVESSEQFEENFDQILAVFSDESISHLEINLVIDTLTKREIKEIVNCIAKRNISGEILNNTIYTLIITVASEQKFLNSFSKIRSLISRIDIVITDDFQRISNIIASLQRKKFVFSLLIKESDFNKVLSLYKKYKKFGASIFDEGEMCYDENFVFAFWGWVYDKNGCRINVFSDILSRILLDYWGTKCQYKSCLTKYFMVDTDGSVYSCQKQKNRICNLKDTSSMREILLNENFVSILKCAISKRTKCKESCQFYKLCQGGCFLDSFVSIDECRDRQLFLLLNDINMRFKQIINDTDYRDLNPAVREIILASAASNKLFEKEMII